MGGFNWKQTDRHGEAIMYMTGSLAYDGKETDRIELHREDYYAEGRYDVYLNLWHTTMVEGEYDSETGECGESYEESCELYCDVYEEELTLPVIESRIQILDRAPEISGITAWG